MGLNYLLISGIPASGKSFFGHWLESKHSYVHVDIEQISCRQRLGLEQVWCGLSSPNGAGSLVKALKALGSRVVLNWGFPPDCLPIIERIKLSSFSAWWFDADCDQARRIFEQRDTVPLDRFCDQMDRIWCNRERIEAVFAPNIITTLDATGAQLSPEDIWARMHGTTAG